MDFCSSCRALKTCVSFTEISRKGKNPQEPDIRSRTSADRMALKCELSPADSLAIVPLHAFHKARAARWGGARMMQHFEGPHENRLFRVSGAVGGNHAPDRLQPKRSSLRAPIRGYDHNRAGSRSNARAGSHTGAWAAGAARAARTARAAGAVVRYYDDGIGRRMPFRKKGFACAIVVHAYPISPA